VRTTIKCCCIVFSLLEHVSCLAYELLSPRLQLGIDVVLALHVDYFEEAASLLVFVDGLHAIGAVS